jgi:hypothetical protein
LGTEEADHRIQTSSLTAITNKPHSSSHPTHDKSTVLVDWDILLIARDTIEPGDELFLSYQGGKTDFEEKQRVWLSLQYGFPF